MLYQMQDGLHCMMLERLTKIVLCRYNIMSFLQRFLMGGDQKLFLCHFAMKKQSSSSYTKKLWTYIILLDFELGLMRDK